MNGLAKGTRFKIAPHFSWSTGRVVKVTTNARSSTLGATGFNWNHSRFHVAETSKIQRGDELIRRRSPPQCSRPLKGRGSFSQRRSGSRFRPLMTARSLCCAVFAAPSNVLSCSHFWDHKSKRSSSRAPPASPRQRVPFMLVSAFHLLNVLILDLCLRRRLRMAAEQSERGKLPFRLCEELKHKLNTVSVIYFFSFHIRGWINVVWAQGESSEVTFIQGLLIKHVWEFSVQPTTLYRIFMTDWIWVHINKDYAGLHIHPHTETIHNRAACLQRTREDIKDCFPSYLPTHTLNECKFAVLLAAC